MRRATGPKRLRDSIGGSRCTAPARDLDGERAALADCAVHAYRSAVEYNQFVHEREADARFFVGASGVVLDPVEALKHTRQFCGWNAHAGVTHRQAV